MGHSSDQKLQKILVKLNNDETKHVIRIFL